MIQAYRIHVLIKLPEGVRYLGYHFAEFTRALNPRILDWELLSSLITDYYNSLEPIHAYSIEPVSTKDILGYCSYYRYQSELLESGTVPPQKITVPLNTASNMQLIDL